MNKIVFLFLLVIIVFGGFLLVRLPHNYPQGEVDLVQAVEIGGMNQWIMASGKSKDLPVMLWLHGGPGAAQLPVSRYFNHNLEQEFIVVQWDQRGAGKSNPAGFSEETMTLERFLQDIQEMTGFLKERFGKDRIYLLGHSWGSQIGILAAHRNPDDYHAYIGVAQVVDQDRAQVLAHQKLKSLLEEKDSVSDLQTLSDLQGPPFRDHQEYVTFARMMDKYNLNMDISTIALGRIALGSGIYSIVDFFRWLNGANRGSGPMWGEIQGWDARERVPSMEIPCFFITGENDFNTPLVLVEDFLAGLHAPRGKELIGFPDAAHTPFFANPGLFFEIIQEIKKEVGE